MISHLKLMGYLIPVTPQAFVNRISIFGPDETNIKEIRYQLSLHLTIPINILPPPKSLELYNFGLIFRNNFGLIFRNNFGLIFRNNFGLI